MDAHSLEMLEFPRVREILAGYTSFSAGRQLAMALEPSADAQAVAALLVQSAEARRLLAARPEFSVGQAADIRESAGLAAKGKTLDPLVLLDIGRTLAAARNLRASLERAQELAPVLWAIGQRIAPVQRLETAIARCITPGGELFDNASPKLAETRARTRTVRQQLVQRLEAITKSSRAEKVLQEPLITERDGRLVIPVKAEARKEVRGIVHDVSNTGATVFIEPWATVELGNEIRELAVEERREIERILAELSADVGVEAAPLALDVDLIAELDLALAKARYAEAVRATEPLITACDTGPSGRAVLKLANARHPLLKGKPVPLTLELGREFQTLIITGPNTGGKTVALKTVGLLILMAQAGLPIPASEESCIPVFDNVFADIGDEQSIERTLSTFSWHVGNITRIIKESTPRSMVLLDELGTSTDPNEGVALAEAILLYFLSEGATVVATTHFSDLKVFAHQTPGVQNASMDFDPATTSPTYHLTVGVPGGSNALATAARLGLPGQIIERAREMMARGPQQVEAMLADLTVERQKLETVRAQLEGEQREAMSMRKRLEMDLARLQEHERNVLRQSRDKLLEEAAGLQRSIRDAEADLKRAKSKDTVDRARRALDRMHEQLAGPSWEPKARDTQPEPLPGAIAIGDRVRVLDTMLEGAVTVISADGRRAEVEAGNTHLSLSIEAIQKVTAAGVEERPRPFQIGATGGHRPLSTEIDLRGKRADEVAPIVDAYLNDAFMANLSQVRIIHGVATGALRQVVREMLSHHPLVKSWQPGKRDEGGDGATTVTVG